MPTFDITRIYSFCLFNGYEIVSCDFKLYFFKKRFIYFERACAHERGGGGVGWARAEGERENSSGAYAGLCFTIPREVMTRVRSGVGHLTN